MEALSNSSNLSTKPKKIRNHQKIIQTNNRIRFLGLLIQKSSPIFICITFYHFFLNFNALSRNTRYYYEFSKSVTGPSYFYRIG